MVQSYQIMSSDDEEVKALLSRVDYLLANNEPYGDVLYRLMDASERLTDSEELFAKSELTYNYSLYNLHRSMGILVSTNNINITEEKPDKEDSLPTIHIRQLKTFPTQVQKRLSEQRSGDGDTLPTIHARQ